MCVPKVILSCSPPPPPPHPLTIVCFLVLFSPAHVLDYIKRYATEALLHDKEDGSTSSASEMSDLSDEEYEVQDMEL